MIIKRIESDGRQGTNDFDFPKDTERREENNYSGGYQGHTEMLKDRFHPF